MHAVIEAGLTLRMIKHQIYSSRDVHYPPFPNHREVVQLTELMLRYTDWVVEDFAEHKKELSELQRRAEQASDVGDRSRLQAEVWKRIRNLKSVEDALTDFTDEERENCRRLIAVAVGHNQDSEQRSEGIARSWLTYEEAESLAPESITQTTMA